MILTPFDAYVLFNSLRLHFQPKSSYNFFQYGGKLRYSEVSFEKSKDKYIFAKIASKYGNREKYIHLILAMLLDKGTSFWVRDLLSDDSRELFIKYENRLQSLSYAFEKDLDIIVEGKNSEAEIMDLVKVSDPSTNPELLNMYLRGDISLETVIILDTILFGFVGKWTKKLSDTIVWPDIAFKIGKYRPFLQFDKTKFEQIFMNKVREAVISNNKEE